jgi:hypothetical protein
MFPTDFLDDDCRITQHVAQRLITLRNQYAYPRAHARFASRENAIHLEDGRSAELVHPEPSSITDLTLDCYHRDLLRSADPVDNLVGTLSTVFWGFYTFSPKYATVRAMRHRDGYREKLPSSPERVARCLQAATVDDLGNALGQLAELSQLGYTPFASKVIAFRFPERAGVLDNKIADGLALSVWARGAPFLNGIGDVSAPRYQRRYAAWCDFLCQVADGMNAGIAAGESWHWGSDNDQQMWRAIDVERALFAHFSDASGAS